MLSWKQGGQNDNYKIVHIAGIDRIISPGIFEKQILLQLQAAYAFLKVSVRHKQYQILFGFIFGIQNIPG